MGLFDFVKDMKTSSNIKKIKKILEGHNHIEQTTKLGSTQKEFGLDTIKMREDSHNNQVELIVDGKVIYKKELQYDGDAIIISKDEDISKLKDILSKKKLETPKYKEAQKARASLMKKLSILDTGNFNSGSTFEGIFLNNEIYGLKYEYKEIFNRETEERTRTVKIWDGEDKVLDQELIGYDIEGYDYSDDNKNVKNIFFDANKILEAKKKFSMGFNNKLKEKQENNKSKKRKM